jgi:hypothetical protein
VYNQIKVQIYLEKKKIAINWIYCNLIDLASNSLRNYYCWKKLVSVISMNQMLKFSYGFDNWYGMERKFGTEKFGIYA